MSRRYELTDYQKGIIYLVVGALILLYAFNFFKAWLNTVVILGGLFLIGYGFLKIGGVEKIRSLLSKK